MSRSLVSASEPLASSSNWVIECGSLLVDCRDEDDAKAIVRGCVTGVDWLPVPPFGYRRGDGSMAQTLHRGCRSDRANRLAPSRGAIEVAFPSRQPYSRMRWTNAAPADLPAQRYEYRSATPGATVSMSTMIGFDCPFQLASCSGGIDLVLDRFTCSPATLGRASVALKTHALFMSAAARP